MDAIVSDSEGRSATVVLYSIIIGYGDNSIVDRRGAVERLQPTTGLGKILAVKGACCVGPLASRSLVATIIVGYIYIYIYEVEKK